MSRVPEYVINVKLAEILNRDLGIDARAERLKGRRRPDIRCFYKGLIIGIEASYSRADAERDAAKRIEQGLVDIALALELKRRYKDLPEQELYETIKRSKFNVKIFTSKEIVGTLIPFIEKGIRKKADPATGWFKDIDLPTIKTIIENSIGLMIKEEEIRKLVEEMKQKISDFTKSLAAIDVKGIIRRNIYNVLYKLYGLSIAEAEDPEVAFGHAALSILLSVVFYEHIRGEHPVLGPIMEYVRKYGYIEGLRRAFKDLLKIDYRVAVKTTIEVLKNLPYSVTPRIKDLVELAVKIASNRSLLRRDFAGRVYHEITGDIALRKGFATFYTEVPAAYLLSSLATETLLGLDEKSIFNLKKEEAYDIIKQIRAFKIGDLACGSGTLLTASYHSLHRTAAALKYYHDLKDIDLNKVGKELIENNIYGIDALRYASQITAINLALIGPSAISKENIYTIYLGYIPEKNVAWLGSLELLDDSRRIGGLLAWIEGGLKGAIEKVSLEGPEGSFQIPDKFHLIIMNPPFTRATGRTEKFRKERGLFGFITDEKARKELLKAFKNLRDKIRKNLILIAESTANLLPSVFRDLIVNRPRELKQYLAVGQAGEGLLFLYLAYKYISNGGVIAFVLPRGLLAGVSWFLARILLASKFHVRYIIVSSDPEKGYNFSEGVSLSECLIVAKRAEEHNDNEETVFINLLSKPSTSLEALMLAEEVKREATTKDIDIVKAGNSIALVFKVNRCQLINNIDNWNRFVAISNKELLDIVMNILRENTINVHKRSIKTPITKLNNIVDTLGVDRHQFHDHFNYVNIETPYPIIYGGEETIRRKMMVKFNAYASLKTKRAKEIFSKYSGRVLVPDRIWWDTAHVIALYSDTPVLSNIFYAIKLKIPEKVRIQAEKALTLWMNTTWGLLTILVSRQETRGRWSSLKMGQWRLLPVLNVCALNANVLKRLAMVFDKYAYMPLRRIPDQFNPKDPDPVRLRIDMEFLKALDPKLEEEKTRKDLLELYKLVYMSLKQWIRG